MQTVLIIGNERTSQGKLKATLKVSGVSLVRRAARAAQAAGSTELLLVGPDEAALRDHLERDRHLRTPISWVPWDGPSSASAMALARAAAAPPPGFDGARTCCGRLALRFWVSTVDRVVSPQLFVRAPLPGDVLAVADASKSPTGVYLARPSFASRCGASPRSLHGLLTEHDPRQVVEHATWHPARTQSERRAARRVVLRSLRKPFGRSADGIVAYHLNRRISRQISRVLVHTAVTPNVVTAVALLVGLAGVFAVARATYWSMLGGALLVQLGSILDGVDGELARMRLTSSKAGEWFDTISDNIVNIGLMVSLGVAASKLTQSSTYVGLASIVGVVIVGIVLSMYRDFVRRGVASHNHYAWAFEDDGFSGRWAFMKPAFVVFSYIAKRDFYTLLFCVLLAVPMPLTTFFVMWGGVVCICIGYAIQKLRVERAGEHVTLVESSAETA